MTKASRIIFAPLAAVILAAAAWATSAGAANAAAQQGDEGRQNRELLSVSGKITSIDRASLTLTVAAARTSSQISQKSDPASNAAPTTMTFVIDPNTTIEGKPTVGANADVIYRQDNSNNIAISVRVAP